MTKRIVVPRGGTIVECYSTDGRTATERAPMVDGKPVTRVFPGDVVEVGISNDNDNVQLVWEEERGMTDRDLLSLTAAILMNSNHLLIPVGAVRLAAGLLEEVDRFLLQEDEEG